MCAEKTELAKVHILAPQPEPSMGALVQRAITDGNLEFAERLMGVVAKERFNAAFAQAYARLPVITKDRTVDFVNLKGTRVNYKYEDFASLVQQVKPILSDYGLTLTHETSNDPDKKLVHVTAILGHELGHERRSTLSVSYDVSGGKNEAQAMGSAQTYGRRYTGEAVLGLAATVDDDARGGADNVADKKPEAPRINQEQKDTLRKLIATADRDWDYVANKLSPLQGYRPHSIGEVEARHYDRVVTHLNLVIESSSI